MQVNIYTLSTFEKSYQDEIGKLFVLLQPRQAHDLPFRTIMSSARCNPAHGKRKCTRCVLRAGAFARSYSLTVFRARTTARAPLLGLFAILCHGIPKPWAAGHLPHQCPTPHEQLHDEEGAAGGIARA
jgi:hypothetical protein